MKTKNKIQIAKIISFFLTFFYKKNQIHTKNKIRWSLDLNEGIDLSIFLFGTSEKKINNLKQLFKLNEKLIIIDIGANVGSISLPLAKIFNKSKIFAIEPTNYAFKKLTKNLNLNKDLKKKYFIKSSIFIKKKQTNKGLV
ncbi:FkbM family methyltransferase [bacterium]|nr:FkbM family methyltransferase [bacterium]MDC1220922.1 FkbM family methyltransferase [bacterium]